MPHTPLARLTKEQKEGELTAKGPNMKRPPYDDDAFLGEIVFLLRAIIFQLVDAEIMNKDQAMLMLEKMALKQSRKYSNFQHGSSPVGIILAELKKSYAGQTGDVIRLQNHPSRPKSTDQDSD